MLKPEALSRHNTPAKPPCAARRAAHETLAGCPSRIRSLRRAATSTTVSEPFSPGAACRKIANVTSLLFQRSLVPFQARAGSTEHCPAFSHGFVPLCASFVSTPCVTLFRVFDIVRD